MISDDVKFTQLGENLRFLGDMRFKQLTLSMGVLATSAAGLGQYGDRDLAPGMRASVAIVLFAMIYTAVSWVMEVRSTLHWIATRNEARDLWPQHHSSWGLGWISATNAVVVFYAIAYACLWRLALSLHIEPLLLAISEALGLGLLITTVVEYSQTVWRPLTTIKRPRDSRRLHSVRRWSHGKGRSALPRGA